ncbi:Ig-like domain-containing protein [Longimicrobium terrae]|uniref:BIG2 domain-containing protein n=1 Tax=Longimicrobium terrae TaxID=1639882 RepID=A0A841H6D4_9BACT|nr:Ig-like domain-containing protein [Longimicrobium terrae]MBB4639232.1 hypothetical protein [Longimicrobium terrae]MBB6073472.1 hypothetical protein [Longimicrobium terrae]NNC32276.1 hypothetical protein [Longimicrobium terrae]
MKIRTPVRTFCVLAFTAFAAACESSTSGSNVDTVIIEADDSEVTVGQSLQLQATAYDDDGEPLNRNDIEWTSSNPSVATVSASGLLTGVSLGTVAITAEVGGEFDTQSFQVVPPVDDGDECPITAINIGSTATGTLSTSDCALDDGTHFDFYAFTVSSTRTVTITLRSSAFDAYLFLLSSDAQVIAQDNDSGGGRDAAITRTLSAGTYVIAANSFNVADGSYTLSVQ